MVKLCKWCNREWLGWPADAAAFLRERGWVPVPLSDELWRPPIRPRRVRVGVRLTEDADGSPLTREVLYDTVQGADYVRRFQTAEKRIPQADGSTVIEPTFETVRVKGYRFSYRVKTGEVREEQPNGTIRVKAVYDVKEMRDVDYSPTGPYREDAAVQQELERDRGPLQTIYVKGERIF